MAGRPTDSSTRRRSMGTTSEPASRQTRQRRSRAVAGHVHGRGSSLLASTSALSFSALDVDETFGRLSASEQLRLYYVSRVVAEVQKIAFLQSSPESPAILVLFQELFCSPEEESSPGELILELQKTCFANGLGDVISGFLEYVMLFYHNFGNYDLLTGTKIIPKIKSFEFESVVLASRAFAQRRGLRLKRAMSVCLDAIYMPEETVRARSQGTSTERKDSAIVAMNEQLTHPFYGAGVGYLDILRVDRELDEHEIFKVNTRIIKQVDSNASGRVIFHVHQSSTGVLPNLNDANGSSTSSSDANSSLKQQGFEQTPAQVIAMQNQDEVRVFRHDYGLFIARIEYYLRLAVEVGLGDLSMEYFKNLSEKIVAFNSAPSISAWNAVNNAWLSRPTSNDEKIDFLLTYSDLPQHRDPTGCRGCVEAYIVVENDFYQQRVNDLLKQRDFLEGVFLKCLPFSSQMKNAFERAQKLQVACVDLVLSSGSCDVIPTVAPIVLDHSAELNDTKLFFIANSAESYRDGLLTAEKKFLLDGLLSDDDASTSDREWDRVAFLRFFVEEVVAPVTGFVLREASSDVVLLPSEVFVDTSDEENEPLLYDSEDSDLEDEDRDSVRCMSFIGESERQALLMNSSFAKRPDRWYKPDETYLSLFHEKLATVLEECRVALAGLLMALDRDVLREICGRWSRGAVSAASEASHVSLAPEDFQADLDKTDDDDLALVYVLLFMRDGMLALAFFSTQQFRWEDDKMLSRYMVLQMLLSGNVNNMGSSTVLPTRREASENVIRVIINRERRRRDISQLALGVDEEAVVGIQVMVDTNTEVIKTLKIRRRSWKTRLQVIVRSWLQHIQWIQMTGDKEAGQHLYNQFSLVNEDDLLIRRFLLASLGDPSLKLEEDDHHHANAHRSSIIPPNLSMHGCDPQPALPTPSLEVRRRVFAVRNPSYFSRDTVWIPSFARATHPSVEERAIETSTSSPRRHAHRNMHEDSDHSTHRQPMEQEDMEDHDIQNANEDHEIPRVELRSFAADLSYAIESAVLNIGVIDDQEKTVGFGF